MLYLHLAILATVLALWILGGGPLAYVGTGVFIGAFVLDVGLRIIAVIRRGIG